MEGRCVKDWGAGHPIWGLSELHLLANRIVCKKRDDDRFQGMPPQCYARGDVATFSCGHFLCLFSQPNPDRNTDIGRQRPQRYPHRGGTRAVKWG